MAKVIPFLRRAVRQKAAARRIVERAEEDVAYRTFDDPEHFRGVILRAVGSVRSMLGDDGNRHFTRDGKTSTLQVHRADADVVADALAHVEQALRHARIVPCSPKERQG